MYIILAGLYETGDVNHPEDCSVLVLQGSCTSDEAKQIIDEEALDYLMNEGTRDMDFDYNFGDVIELCYEDAFAERLSRRGLSLVSTPVIDINVFEHDDVIVTRDEVLER